MSVQTEELGTPEPAAGLPAPQPSGSGTWSLSWHGVRTVTTLELRQRVRSTRWIVSLIAFGLLVGGVTALVWAVNERGDPLMGGPTIGSTMFGYVVFFVLFLGLLVSPTLSATAINGDRAAGTLATLQVTLLSAAEIVIGKLLAAWLASLAFLAVSTPFLAWAMAAGGTSVLRVVVTLLLLATVLAVVCAIGLGFSSLTARTAGSAVLTYVGVASLTVLSLIVFGLTMPLVSGMEEVEVYDVPPSAWEEGVDPYTSGVECEWRTQEQYVTHTERTWWLLAINPFVIVADAAPYASTDPTIQSFDPLSAIRQGVRLARAGAVDRYDYCWTEEGGGAGPLYDTGHLDDGPPVWPWGLAANLLLGAGGVLVAVRRLTIPQRTLAKGTRVA